MAVREIAPVAVPRGGVTHALRVVTIVLRRDLIRFVNDVGRASAMIFQGILWLFVVGGGFGGLMPGTPGGLRLETVIFPGVISMTVIVTAVSAASSIVWDREFGFMREMLVAPVGRGPIVIGKVLAGTVLAGSQGLVILALAGLAGVPYDPLLLVKLVFLMFLAAFALSAFGVAVAVRVKGLEAYLGISQFLVMPLVFLSGALFPVGNLPSWMETLTLINPLTYAVDPIRQAVFVHIDAPPAAEALFNPGITWYGWTVPVTLEVALVGGAGLLFLIIAAVRLRRND